MEYHVEEADAAGVAYAPFASFCQIYQANRIVSLCMFAFGLITVCTGLVKNYGGFVATRLALGTAEAGELFRCCQQSFRN